MKRSCESTLSEEEAVDKKTCFTVNLPNISNVNLENIHISVDLPPECATEVVHSHDGSQISQDEDSLVAETSFGILVEFMDITEPLSKLRDLLEQRTGMNLSDYQFYLQDTQELDPSKNLVNQCVQGEGLVQINVDVTDKGGLKKINIIDVLKPIDEVPVSPLSTPGESAYMELTATQKSSTTSNPEHITRWLASPEFKKIQEKYNIPLEPFLWTSEHVKHWFDWASSYFKLPEVDDLDMTGAQLMISTSSALRRKIPVESNHLFWTHHELLRRFKIVGIPEPPSAHNVISNGESTPKNVLKSRNKTPRIGAPRIAHEGSPGYSGQIQLWQFLLELLTDKDHRSFIQWVGNEGEFKLINPEMVAQLWGQRKNKPTMNYEKLSRALRYYYDGEMIAKVHGKRFVYKFVYDLKSLLGYDASQLNRLVTECAMKHAQNKTTSFSPVDSTASSGSQC